jgi:hypothetical protein
MNMLDELLPDSDYEASVGDIWQIREVRLHTMER